MNIKFFSEILSLVISSSLFLYVRFFLVWIMVLTADFLLEFRFEYLWPFWLLLRSAYDSFKYQGLVSLEFSRNLPKISRFLSFIGRLSDPKVAIINVVFVKNCFSIRDSFQVVYFPVIFLGILTSFPHTGFLFGSNMFDVSACTLVVLCREHLCLGSVRLAYR